MVRIRTFVAFAAGLFAAPVQCWSARCDLAHAQAVPVVKNLPYTEARAAVLATGWSPQPGRPHNELSDNENNFRERGYRELQFCRLNAQSLCRFAFAGPSGVSLWLTTTGEENPALGTQAVVIAAKLACGTDGDPG